MWSTLRGFAMKLLTFFMAGALTYAMGFISCGAILLGVIFTPQFKGVVKNYERGVRILNFLERRRPWGEIPLEDDPVGMESVDPESSSGDSEPAL